MTPPDQPAPNSFEHHQPVDERPTPVPPSGATVAESVVDELPGQEDGRVAEREAGLAVMERLVSAVRALDQAASLSDVLNLVTIHARPFVDGRVVTLIVDDNRLTVWQAHGLEGAAEAGASFELAADTDCVAAVAARTGNVHNTRDTHGAGMALQGLNCAPLPDDRVGLAIPLLVGGQAVAVLYADDVNDSGEPAVPNSWPEALEIVARHAAARLERLTLDRAYGLHLGSTAAPGAPGQSAANDARTSESPRSQGVPADSEDESAQRYARLLISEIRLYHEDAVSEGQREGNLLTRLEPEISRARRLYEQRVPVQVRARGDYFRQELIRTLANGDARVLGQSRDGNLQQD